MSNSQNINLIFIFQGNSYSIQCQENDKLNAIFLRFATKAQIDIKDLIFYHNAKEVPSCDKTLFNLQIKSNSTFSVVKKMLLVLD